MPVSLHSAVRMVLLAIPMIARTAHSQTTTPSAPRFTNPCFGAPYDLVLSNGLPYIHDFTLSGVAGSAILDWGSNTSAVDPVGFTSSPPPPKGPVPGYPDEQSYSDLHYLYRNWATAALHQVSMQGNHIPQAARLGTDFLSADVWTLNYQSKKVHANSQNFFCKDDVIRSEGLHSVSSQGHYTNDVGTIKALNIPTIPVAIAGIQGEAQVDTGFAPDQYKYSVAINQPYFDALVAAHFKLTKLPGKTRPLGSCGSLSDDVTAYSLPSGTDFHIIDTDGKPLLSHADVVLLLKPKRAEMAGCGGIALLDEPSAQFGADFLQQAGAVIFDSYSSRVWLADSVPHSQTSPTSSK